MAILFVHFSPISEVHGSYFISNHKIVSCLVEFLFVANHQDKVVTFPQYHKINVDRPKEDLAVSALVAYPSVDLDTLMNNMYLACLISEIFMLP